MCGLVYYDITNRDNINNGRYIRIVDLHTYFLLPNWTSSGRPRKFPESDLIAKKVKREIGITISRLPSYHKVRPA